MCFKNLPIDFDDQGKAFLRGGIRDPYSTKNTITSVGDVKTMPYDTVRELLSRNGYIKDVDFDPVTRVAGALAFHGVADLENRKFIEARSMATLFRGYELIMQGRDPRAMRSLLRVGLAGCAVAFTRRVRPSGSRWLSASRPRRSELSCGI